MKDKMKEALWSLIERHYNVDRRQPQVLTAKFPASSNQIDRIGEEFAEFFEALLQASTIAPTLQMEEEEEEVELIIDLDDDSSYPEDLFLDLDDMGREGTEDDPDSDDPLAAWWI